MNSSLIKESVSISGDFVVTVALFFHRLRRRRRTTVVHDRRTPGMGLARSLRHRRQHGRNLLPLERHLRQRRRLLNVLASRRRQRRARGNDASRRQRLGLGTLGRRRAGAMRRLSFGGKKCRGSGAWNGRRISSLLEVEANSVRRRATGAARSWFTSRC